MINTNIIEPAILCSDTSTDELALVRTARTTVVRHVECTQAVRMPQFVGSRHPVHCSSLGRSILAFSSPEVIEQYLQKCTLTRFTRNTITTPALLLKELELIRESGYSID